MAKTFYEAIIAQAGFAGEVFDVAAGPANTGVINSLLSALTATTIAVASNGAALPQATINVASTVGFPTSGKIYVVTTNGPQVVTYTGTTGTTFTGASGGTGTMATGGAVTAIGSLTNDAPVNIISTGALGTAATLDLSAIEDPGRFFFLSARNSDIATNNLTILVTTSIMGGPATLVLNAAADYIVVHESGGTWRAYKQSVDVANEAVVFRTAITAAEWTAGATKNQIVITGTAAPGAGQVGPHNLGVYPTYAVLVVRSSDNSIVDVATVVDPVTGNITLSKTGLGAAFNGNVLVIA